MNDLPGNPGAEPRGDTAAARADLILRGAKTDELAEVHRLLVEEIRRNPHYNAEFKAHEERRMTLAYLKHLHAVDPDLVFVAHRRSRGRIAGFFIASPDCGHLWLHWGVALQEFRDGRRSLITIRAMVKSLDNGRWSKICTAIRTSNRPALILMRACGFKPLCVLKDHWFGQDYKLLELPLNKVVPGYDTGYRPGRVGRVRQALRRLSDG